jgi:hypothetical protein
VKAYFDSDGRCLFIANGEIEHPDICASAIVRLGTQSQDIWWDGENVQSSKPTSLEIPTVLELNQGKLRVPLPLGPIAHVNGQVQKDELIIEPGKVGPIYVEILGSEYGSFVIEVKSYSEQRAESYDPIPDQMDALWKGFEALSSGSTSPEAMEMLSRIKFVKEKFPKSDS